MIAKTWRVALKARASNDDGSIAVTVGSNGQIEGLELADRDLARRILAVMRTAQQRLSAQVALQVEQTVGVDTETGRAVVASFAHRFPARQERDDDQ